MQEERQRFRVLLVLEDGFTADGFFEHVAKELPGEGALIQVRETRKDGQVLHARVHHVDPQSSLPIAAVEVLPA